MEKLQSGYMYKSPMSGPQVMKSWKRRFFTLLKMSDNVHHLKYYEHDKTDKPLGSMDMSEVLLVLFCPESHNMWGWIHKNFGRPASCVLLLKTADRDYFLIGDNSTEMDDWYKILLKTQRHQPTREVMSEKCEKCDKKEELDGYMEMAVVEFPPVSAEGGVLASVAQALQELDRPDHSESQAKKETDNPSELLTPVEMDVCVSKDNLKRHLSLTEEEKACCNETADILLVGDEILAINDINVDNSQEVEKYLSKLQKNEVKVTVRRLSQNTEDVISSN
ncbi:pleckstrin homology domain-containing family S member 1-like isoform X2 [Alosa sapidissima]|uniref:pleckstrin homology domain-containing family S member 1-like isoform X2 n=1 Tax=Alosa sapidissima TaxID=34773 RepID=UPI001C090977|nr:pleckstrin homology domain-containing family S member 1-like isoform X2 [Alosa sapidissima]